MYSEGDKRATGDGDTVVRWMDGWRNVIAGEIKILVHRLFPSFGLRASGVV